MLETVFFYFLPSTFRNDSLEMDQRFIYKSIKMKLMTNFALQVPSSCIFTNQRISKMYDNKNKPKVLKRLKNSNHNRRRRRLSYAIFATIIKNR